MADGLKSWMQESPEISPDNIQFRFSKSETKIIIVV